MTRMRLRRRERYPRNPRSNKFSAARQLRGITHRGIPSHSAMHNDPTPSKALRIASWIARVVTAVILLQAVFFKFTGAPESVYIFTTVGQEPWGRYGSGIVELIASVLLFFPRGVALGALLALGTMCGAVFFHLTKLGIVVQNDGGL